MSRQTLIGSLACIVFFSTAHTSLRAQTIRDDAEHYSFQLPDTWDAMSADSIAQINKFANDRLPGKKIQYVRGFKIKGAADGLFPYILVQHTHQDLTRVSYEQLERSLAQDMGTEVKSVENAMSDVGKNLAVNTPVLDRTKNQIVTRVQMDLTGVGKIKGISSGHLSTNSIITVICYALDADFDNRLPEFQQIDNSLKIDAANVFKPASFLSNIFNGSWNGGLIGGMVAAAYVIFRSFSKKAGPVNRPS